MDRKSFFRGFGVGVLFAAAILGLSFMIRTSDSYVKSRAKELGMSYTNKEQGSQKVLASDHQATSEPESSPAATEKVENTQVPEKSDAPKESQAPKESRNPEGSASPKGKATDKPSSSSKPSKKEIDMKKEKDRMEKNIRDEMNLVIKAGDWSSTVSKKLEQMGIVKSAVDFDSYLEKNGYSSKITAGTYKVSKKDSYSQLARKITGR